MIGAPDSRAAMRPCSSLIAQRRWRITSKVIGSISAGIERLLPRRRRQPALVDDRIVAQLHVAGERRRAAGAVELAHHEVVEAEMVVAVDLDQPPLPHQRRALVIVVVGTEAVVAEAAAQRALAIVLDRLDGVRHRVQDDAALDLAAAGVALDRAGMLEALGPQALARGERPALVDLAAGQHDSIDRAGGLLRDQALADVARDALRLAAERISVAGAA